MIMQGKNTKQCPSCGKTIPSDAVFCPACGSRLTGEKAVGKKCPSCGAAMEVDAIFCASCGNRFEEKTAAVTKLAAAWLKFSPEPRLLMILLAAAVVLLLLSFGTIAYLYVSKNDAAARSSAKSEDSKKIVKTEKSVYRYGEKIYVHYSGAPGLRSDWICIAPAGSPDNTVGTYQYIPALGVGTLVFDSPKPGRYEVRAFYRYNPGHYKVTGRWRFTVAD